MFAVQHIEQTNLEYIITHSGSTEIVYVTDSEIVTAINS